MTFSALDILGELEGILASGGIVDAHHEARQIAEAVGVHVGEAEPRWNALTMEKARTLAEKRMSGVPLAYVLGRHVFMGVDLIVAAGALIPRQETEVLGHTALDTIRTFPADRELRVIDMCCGSGNLACAIAAALPRLKLWASDLTPESVAIARKNVERLKLHDRVHVGEGDLFAPLSTLSLEGSIDVVVCNPPYISTQRLGKDRSELLVHEPREAFDGGPYGLSIHQRVLKEATRFLRVGGWLMFEFGLGQGKQITRLFERAGTYDTISLKNDAAGEPRVAVGRKSVE